MDFQDLYDNKEDSDIIIKIGTKIIYAHKIILKKKSAMFRSNTLWKENQTGVFEFSSCDPQAIEVAIKWIYGIKTNILNTDAFCEIISIANYLQMTDFLNELTTGPIPSSVTFIDLIQLSRLYNSQLLMNRALNKCKSELKSVDKIAELICKNLSIDEYEAFRSQWIIKCYSPYALFFFDCRFASANSDSHLEAVEVLNRFIPSISFHTLNASSLKSIQEFPIIRDAPAIKHILSCLIEVKQNINEKKMIEVSTCELKNILDKI